MATGVTEWNDRQVSKKLETLLLRNMKKAVAIGANNAKRLVSRGNKTGRNPSLPYEPPKVVKGNLRSNISFDAKLDGKGGVVGAFGVIKNATKVRGKMRDWEYALLLELGTSRMKKRPYLRPTLKKYRQKMLNKARTG